MRRRSSRPWACTTYASAVVISGHASVSGATGTERASASSRVAASASADGGEPMGRTVYSTGAGRAASRSAMTWRMCSTISRCAAAPSPAAIAFAIRTCASPQPWSP